MESIKEDKKHSHSIFIEYTICLLIAFEIAVELHAMDAFPTMPWAH